mmetsp:Transcript_31463/g.68586  ORF Transcript_31463/g.68586 Transcript_31463/m.68586 type:complete len:394 (+) Transcript_31463:72-1253(+)
MGGGITRPGRVQPSEESFGAIVPETKSQTKRTSRWPLGSWRASSCKRAESRTSSGRLSAEDSLDIGDTFDTLEAVSPSATSPATSLPIPNRFRRTAAGCQAMIFGRRIEPQIEPASPRSVTSIRQRANSGRSASTATPARSTSRISASVANRRLPSVGYLGAVSALEQMSDRGQFAASAPARSRAGSHSHTPSMGFTGAQHTSSEGAVSGLSSLRNSSFRRKPSLMSQSSELPNSSMQSRSSSMTSRSQAGRRPEAALGPSLHGIPQEPMSPSFGRGNFAASPPLTSSRLSRGNHQPNLGFGVSPRGAASGRPNTQNSSLSWRPSWVSPRNSTMRTNRCQRAGGTAPPTKTFKTFDEMMEHIGQVFYSEDENGGPSSTAPTTGRSSPSTMLSR